jgi:hypothetical protein
MSTFGFYPGPIDYWMLITDWRNGSIAIILAIGAFVVGYAFRRDHQLFCHRQRLFCPPMQVLRSPKARLLTA